MINVVILCPLLNHGDGGDDDDTGQNKSKWSRRDPDAWTDESDQLESTPKKTGWLTSMMMIKIKTMITNDNRKIFDDHDTLYQEGHKAQKIQDH